MGDRVSLFENMSMIGTVIDMRRQKSDQWMTGGSMDPLFIVKVKLDSDGTEIEFRADKLMRVD